ncbi:hypothetical protein [Bradyrhizobium sp. AUGA SZCCT0160]|uniref:hypothetical protein n=1 Tax=Bradyrhizobium sp. AUGA SZCCT0160 TaxID=2807662 RepID=UPI001BA5B1F7|nr:hypothetical protein [Bradyrhizobium sp. AUGA SZCCT0160]MBR1190081.1 hypothetical protein [Bradyrhizobium sp. AUGA SZCCT0160]
MEKSKKAKKPVGRPRSGIKRPVIALRVHELDYEALKASAEKKHVSMSEDAAERLSESLGRQDRFPGIEQIAMLVASTFWHAGQRANGFEGYDTTKWMKDPACYREAFVAAAGALLHLGMPQPTRIEKEAALEALRQQVLGDDQ